MDTSKEYIKMCEKAKEIQRIWKTNATTGDVTQIGVLCSFEEYHNDDTYDFGFGDTDIQITNAKELTWLPRQDQLQGMVPINSYSCVAGADGTILGRFYQFYKDIRHHKPCYKTYEQLWLAFVMKEKYNKTWNGEDWVKERRG